MSTPPPYEDEPAGKNHETQQDDQNLSTSISISSNDESLKLKDKDAIILTTPEDEDEEPKEDKIEQSRGRGRSTLKKMTINSKSFIDNSDKNQLTPIPPASENEPGKNNEIQEEEKDDQNLSNSISSSDESLKLEDKDAILRSPEEPKDKIEQSRGRSSLKKMTINSKSSINNSDKNQLTPPLYEDKPGKNHETQEEKEKDDQNLSSSISSNDEPQVVKLNFKDKDVILRTPEDKDEEPKEDKIERKSMGRGRGRGGGRGRGRGRPRASFKKMAINSNYSDKNQLTPTPTTPGYEDKPGAEEPKDKIKKGRGRPRGSFNKKIINSKSSFINNSDKNQPTPPALEYKPAGETQEKEKDDQNLSNSISSNDESQVVKFKDKDAILRTPEDEEQPKEKDGEATEVYIVEKVLDKKVTGRRVYYFLKWVGFPSEQNTWEPSSNMECDALIKEYEDGLIIANKAKAKEIKKKKDMKKKEKAINKKINKTKKDKKELMRKYKEQQDQREKQESLELENPMKIEPGEVGISGLDYGYIPESILGFTERNGETLLLVKFKDTNKAELIPKQVIRYKFPQLLIDAYEERSSLNKTNPKPDEQDQDQTKA